MYTKLTYTGDGTDRTYTLSWPYIFKEHVKARVDNVDVTITWDSDSLVRISPVAASGSTVIFERYTPLNERLVDYVGSTVLDEQSLNLDSKQALYLIQEEEADRKAADDAIEAGLQVEIGDVESTLQDNLDTVESTLQENLDAVESQSVRFPYAILPVSPTTPGSLLYINAAGSVTSLTLDTIRNTMNAGDLSLVDEGYLTQTTISTADEGVL